MVVVAAFWIKSALAIWTFVVAVKIIVNGNFCFALPAENRICVPFILWPYRNFVVSQFLMAMNTGIISITAFKFNGNNI